MNNRDISLVLVREFKPANYGKKYSSSMIKDHTSWFVSKENFRLTILWYMNNFKILIKI